jgi:PAS domain S-box-containing protein
MLNPQNKIRVLVIDDDEDDYFLIKEFIEDIEAEKFIVDWSPDYSYALKNIQSKNYDIYFVDYRLGNETGLELLQDAINSGCEEPIIVLTGKGNRAIDIEAMRIGATDYLLKPDLNTEKLERSMRYALERSMHLKSLRQKEKKYKSLFDQSKDAVFIADQNLTFKEANSATHLLMGLKMTDLLDKTLYDFINDDVKVEFIKNKLIHFQNIYDINIEIVNSKTTELKYCLLSLTFESNEDHQFIHGIIHDITSLKQTEKITLQVEKFAANERLIGIIAHEVRNPLTNISLAIDQLMMTSDNADKQFMQIIKRNTLRINQLIKELLDFSRSVELSSRKIAVQEILDETLANSADRLQLQHINVTRDFPPYPLFIMADQSKLTIALSNIILNAIEAMEENTGQLYIKIEEDEHYCTLLIRDNGKGIPQEHLSRISEPFFTLKRNGMGIGLAATFSILRSHKANVNVESNVGVGTKFIINFEKINQLRN